jgi:DNA-binding transcriptional ArsR family regulator
MQEPELIEALRALAHPVRWRILSTLLTGERNVGEIERESGIMQPALSQQLGVLRKAGLVATRKDSKLVFYTLAHSEFGAIKAALEAFAPSDIRTTLTVSETTRQKVPAPGVANFARIA